MFTTPSLKLTDAAVITMLQAAVKAADDMGQPQCIVIVDVSGVELGVFRMVGARYLSLKSARAKALTAASIGGPSRAIPEAMGPGLAAATQGDVTRLGGGLPIRVDGQLVGGIGIGSGSPEQDENVAKAALISIGAEV
ncbi:GlcG/HbpS family heme-binding protein [Roseobacteraceae bacterium S113]